MTSLALALALPLAGLGAQWLVWEYIDPLAWFLFFPVVFFSARLAGVAGGVGSAAISAILVEYFFVPPRFSWSIGPGSLWPITLFIVMGFLFGRVHERLDAERRRTEAALDRTEQSFKGIVEQSLAGIYLVQGSNFTYVNPEFARIFGFSNPEEVIDKIPLEDLVAPNDRARVLDVVTRRLAGELPEMRYSFKGVRKDGAEIEVQVHGRTIDYEDGPAIIGVAVDNTDRIRALEALHESNSLLVRTSALAKVGGWQFAVPSLVGNWTDEIARIHDLDPAISVGAAEGIHYYEGWSKDAIEKAVEDAIEHQQPYDLELELISAKGVHKWVRTVGQPVVVDGKTVRVEGTMQDVTDRVHAQFALRRSEERYRSLVDQAVDGIFVTDAQSRYTDVNPAGCEMLGYSFEEITSLSIPDVIHPKDVGRLPSEVARFEGGAVVRSEWRFVRKDGSEFDGEILGKQLPDGRLQAILRDITERKLAEQTIRELNVGLERRVEHRTAEVTAANRELEAFAYAVSHDLRAPLRAMSGFCQALKEDYGTSLDENGERYVEHIVSASRNMGELIDGLLILSRATRGDMERGTVDVSVLADRFVAQRRLVHPEREVESSIDPDLSVYGDPRMLEVLVQNLINNAWKYTGKTEHPAVAVRGELIDGKRWISVSDNGAGFDSRYAGQLFEPFHRLHRQDDFPGLGIGLATVKRIVNRHGGEIHAEASPGKGATFRFWLPAQDEALELSAGNG